VLFRSRLMREQNTFSAIKSTIRARDFALQGSLNPNLADYGTDSEAKQYSGVVANGDLTCPFQAVKGRTQKARP
jgi:FPC/CPF motif-containing protein YcgG